MGRSARRRGLDVGRDEILLPQGEDWLLREAADALLETQQGER